MNTVTSRSRSLLVAGSLLLGSTSGAFAADLVLQKAPPLHEKADLSLPGSTLGLVSYTSNGSHAAARALYVSSGREAKLANNMIDEQTSTTYSFAAEDTAPTTLIDLGEASAVRRLSAVYSPRAGKMDFYVLQALPKAKGASANATGQTVALDASTISSMQAIGSVTDDGTQGRASVDFPETSGRYVMVRWTPAVQKGGSFTVAEVSAVGSAPSRNLLAANTAAAPSAEETSSGTQVSDGKTMLDGKTMIDAKDMPGEGPVDEAPQSPGEGPAPTLPQPPPFTFVPVLVPTSP